MAYRILHMADLHMEASFASSGVSGQLGAWRRADLQATLARLLALAREQQVDAVTIGGDLFEDRLASVDISELLAQQFSKLAPIRVFVAPGECDPYTSDSLYALTRWSENVSIFSRGELTRVTLAPGLFLWGAACPPLPAARLMAPREVGRHLLLLHAICAHERAFSQRGLFAVTERDLRQGGWAGALLGHQHGAQRGADDIFIYPGSPEPLAPEEDALRHGVALLTVGETDLHVELLPTNQWRYVTLRVDLDGCETDHEVARRVHHALAECEGSGDQRTICYLTIQGRPAEPLDRAKLVQNTSSPMQVVWRFALSGAYDPEVIQQEQTVRGLLARRFLARSADTSLQERDGERAVLEMALGALDGKQVQDDATA
ncbi:MAG: hypothetical protein GX601_06525 [Anaerolineales bacterium]|nr:hypothetical protein [Anaerolineales bacterium]